MRLSHRLTLVFSLFGLAIAGGLEYAQLRSVRNETYRQHAMTADIAATAVKTLVEEKALQGGSLQGLGRALEEIVQQAGVATVVVLDAKGKRLVGRSDDARWLSREAHPGVNIANAVDGIYDVEREVSLGGRGKGTVLIGFHTDALEARLARIAGEGVRNGVMALLGVMLLAYLLGTWFGLRVEQIVPRVEALPRDPEGFRPIRVGGGGDEVSRLAAAFNRLGQSLKLETARRRELELEKQELSAMLVHDLKTPLTVIRSGITLLQEQFAEEAAVKSGNGRGPKRTFELLDLSTRRLHRMVEDVLQLAKLEEISGLREKGTVDLTALAQACAKDFELVAADRGQKVALKLPKTKLPEVLGDATLLRRVLDNLVHNAVEHTPKGGTITIAVAQEGAGVRTSVSDTGPGVPPEARADIFRKFFQKDVKRFVGNVGLGLALCEKVVLRHGGSIAIEDAKPRGACFYFVLPSVQPDLI